MHIPGEAYPRAKILLRRNREMAILGRVGVKQRARRFRLWVDGEGIEVRAAIPTLDRPGRIVVPQPQIQGQTTSDLPVILKKASIRCAMEREEGPVGLAAA